MNGNLPSELAESYRRLVVADMQRQLPGQALEDTEEPTDEELARLVSAASRLALSKDPADKKAAYEIVSRVIELKQGELPGFGSAAEVILPRLGNFPGRELLRARREEDSNASREVPLYLSLEAISREVENSVEGPDGKPLPLTDFQHDLLGLMSRFSAVSVSAPTSAGKSFVLSLDLVRRLRDGLPICVVYVVPTRALIRQVMLRIVQDLNKAGLTNIPVRCVPIPIDRDSAPQGVVYVLTQERLMSLLYSDRGDPWITVLFVDESQGIGEGARGIVLQTAVETVLRRFPGLEVYFASPLTKNPEYLLALFQRQERSIHLTETRSPVSQNKLLVSQIRYKPSQARLTLLTDSGSIELGSRALSFRLDELTFKRRALLAKAVTGDDESTIVYANGARDAEKIADALVDGETEPETLSQEIADFVEFLGEHVHTEYGLIRVLRHRVAYHYGNMPAIVRSRIEDLAEAGILRFICCTSTLLQGVNLPTRHIVMENPRRGKGKPMTAGDFRNLAGRAGRLLKEFHGNIWCLRPNEWDIRSYESQELQEITSAFAEALRDGGSLVRRLLDEQDIGSSEKSLGEAVLGKVYSEFTKVGQSLEGSAYRTETNSASLRETEELCNAIQSPLPVEVFRKNSTTHPKKLNRLYEFLRSCEDLSEWLPLQPTEPDSNIRMSSIIMKAGSLLGDLRPTTLVYYGVVAASWIHEVPLRGIIERRFTWLRNHNRRFEINDEIRHIMAALESGVRYQCVKFARAYEDVLAFVLTERGEPDAAAELPSIHVYLECGASSPVVLSLISLGLSRTTSILLKGQIAFPEDASPEVCLGKLGATDLNTLRLPRLCRLEIEGLLRPHAGSGA